MPFLLASRLQPRRVAIRKPGLLFSLVLTIIFSLAPLAKAQDADDSDSYDSHVRIVRISYVDGEVRMDSGHGWENITMNVPVSERNWLQTRSDGWVEVQFEDGSLLRLAPDSQVIFTELARASSGGTLTTVDIDLGEAEFKVAKHDDNDFQVTVKKKTIVLVQSGTFRVTSTNSNPMEVVVFKGEVAVRDPDSGDVIAVKKNETFALDPGDFTRYALDKGAEADALDEWSKQRDDYLSTYASARSNTQSPYQYGASDLTYYGQYYDVPEYGSVWQPSGVGVSWDPFSNGYWAYSPGFGYTWVSAYPWGWLPFRYGHWVFVNGRGWCWAPGEWNRWHTGPRWTKTNAPPGFHPPVRPPDRKEDRKIVGGGTGQVTRPGAGVGGGGGRRVGTRPDDRDRDDSAQAHAKRRVLTNEDVQTRTQRGDVPAPQPAGPAQSEPKPQGAAQVERKPAIVDQHQQPEGGTQIHRGEEGRFRGDREPASVPPVSRAQREDKTATAATPPPPATAATPPPPSQQVRQNNPPPQSYSPPPQVHHSDPAPPAPAQHSVPAAAPPAAAPAPQRQSAPPPESHSRADDGSTGRPK